MIVHVIVPRALAEFCEGQRALDVEVPEPATVGDAVAAVARIYPALGRRIVDETGELRRFVNVYVGLEECRPMGGLAAPVPQGVEVSVIGSIAGG